MVAARCCEESAARAGAGPEPAPPSTQPAAKPCRRACGVRGRGPQGARSASGLDEPPRPCRRALWVVPMAARSAAPCAAFPWGTAKRPSLSGDLASSAVTPAASRARCQLRSGSWSVTTAVFKTVCGAVIPSCVRLPCRSASPRGVARRVLRPSGRTSGYDGWRPTGGPSTEPRRGGQRRARLVLLLLSDRSVVAAIAGVSLLGGAGGDRAAAEVAGSAATFPASPSARLDAARRARRHRGAPGREGDRALSDRRAARLVAVTLLVTDATGAPVKTRRLAGAVYSAKRSRQWSPSPRARSYTYELRLDERLASRVRGHPRDHGWAAPRQERGRVTGERKRRRRGGSAEPACCRRCRRRFRRPAGGGGRGGDRRATATSPRGRRHPRPCRRRLPSASAVPARQPGQGDPVGRRATQGPDA